MPCPCFSIPLVCEWVHIFKNAFHVGRICPMKDRRGGASTSSFTIGYSYIDSRSRCTPSVEANALEYLCGMACWPANSVIAGLLVAWQCGLKCAVSAMRNAHLSRAMWARQTSSTNMDGATVSIPHSLLRRNMNLRYSFTTAGASIEAPPIWPNDRVHGRRKRCHRRTTIISHF